jgi:uncharacterized protein (TIGR02598 family)
MSQLAPISAGSARAQRAFSLIEVIFALAIFSISILTMVGLMATGLNSAEDSSGNLAVANIQRLLRANLDATSYAKIAGLGTTPAYFTAAGYPTVQNPASTVDDPYYTVSYTVQSPNNSVVNSNSAEVVLVTVSSPYPVNTRTTTFSLFVAQ